MEANDHDLLRATLAGDEEAFAMLYRLRHPSVYRFALQMSGSAAVAEDVTQEVFLFLMRQGSSFDPNRGSLSSFLLGVTRNYVLRRLRGEHFLISLGDDVDDEISSFVNYESVDPGPLNNLTRAETIETVRRAVLSLPEKYREVVVLCELQEMSYVEAAEVLGCALGTVRSRLHRARAMLLGKLQPLQTEEVAAASAARCFA